jgi:transposase-like protein
MKKGAKKSETKPSEVVTDALASYNAAIRNELGSIDHPIIHLTGSLTKAQNNRMERWNGTLKHRTKVMAGFQNAESVARFTNGFIAHYNFVRAHEALNYLTPSQMVGLTEEKLSWLDLIVAARPVTMTIKNPNKSSLLSKGSESAQ